MRRVLLLTGVSLLALGGWLAVSSAPPDDGIDHGGNPCSGAIFEVLGIGSEDTNTNVAAREGAPSGKSTISYCRDAARDRLALAGVLLVLGTAALVGRRATRSDPPRALAVSR